VVRGSFTNIITGASTRFLRLRGDGDGEWFSNIGDGPGGLAVISLYKEAGAGTWTLWGTNTYSGNTVVNDGTLLVNGVISSPTVTVNTGTLGGTGLLTGAVTVNGSGTLAPGTAATIGTLTISNSLALGGATVLKVAHSGCDQVVGLSNLSPGGTLQIVVVGQLWGGEVFKLFDSATFSGGDFWPYDLPDIGPFLAWDATSVWMDGTLRVTGTLPHIGQITQQPDRNYQLSGVGPDGQTYSILATTNVNLPIADWVPVGSGTFTSGAFTFTDLGATNYPRRFYNVVTP